MKKYLLILFLGGLLFGCDQSRQEVIEPMVNVAKVDTASISGANLRPSFITSRLIVSNVRVRRRNPIAGDGSIFYELVVTLKNTGQTTIKYTTVKPFLKIITPSSPKDNPAVPWKFYRAAGAINIEQSNHVIGSGETYEYNYMILDNVSREILRLNPDIDLYLDLRFYEGVGPSWNTSSSGPWRIQSRRI